MASRVSVFPRKQKDEKNLSNTIKGKRHLLKKVTFKFERPDIRKFIKSAFKIEHTCDSELTVFQFCMIAFVQNFDLNHIQYLLRLCLIYGIALTLFLYILSTFLISMPVYMIFLSMASYSKKGPVAFWDSVPIFRGFVISWALTTIMNIVESIKYICSLIYMMLSMSDYHSALDCGHERLSRYSCIPARNNYTKITFRNCTYLFSTFSYTKVLKSQGIGSKYNITLMICIIGLTAITIWISLHGLNTTKKLLQFLTLFCQGIFYIIIIMTLFIVTKFPVSVDILSVRKDPLFNLNYWNSIMPITIQLLSIGDIVWLGRFKPKKIRPDVFSIILHMFRYAFYVIMCSWLLYIVQNIMANYGISPRCIHRIGFFYFPTGVVDVLLRQHPSGLPAIVLLFVVALMHLVGTIYRTTSILDAFLELKLLKNQKKYLVLAIFVTAVIITLQSAYSQSPRLSWHWAQFFVKPWWCFQFFIACTSVIHVYSIKRFTNDYQFTYGHSPGRAWMKLWQGITISVLLLTVLICNWMLTLIEQIYNNAILSVFYPTIFWLFTTMPTFLIFVLYSCTYIKKHATYQATLPLHTWGPKTRAQKIARAKFLPERDIKYRHGSVTCKHTCLVKLQTYVLEKKHQSEQILQLIRDVEDAGNVYGDTLDSSSDEEGLHPTDNRLGDEEMWNEDME